MTQNDLAAEFGRIAHHPTTGWWAGPLGVLGAYYAGEPIPMPDDDPLELWASPWAITEIGAPGTPRGERLQREAEERHNPPFRAHWFIGKVPPANLYYAGMWGIFRRFERDENVLFAVQFTHSDAVGYVIEQIEGRNQ